MRSQYFAGRSWMEQAYKGRIFVAPQAALTAAVILLTVPIKWVIGWFLAAAIHEIFHCIGVWICGNRILSVQIGVGGAKLQTDLSDPVKEILCLLAGPAGALLLIFFSASFPQLAVCALFQSVYNLLPLSGLDGGQVLSRIVSLAFQPNNAKRISAAMQYATLVCITLTCLYGSILLNLGVFPMLMAGILFLRHGKIKIPCKRGHHRVQ